MGATCQARCLCAPSAHAASCAHEARQAECGEPANPKGCAHACRVCRQVVHTGATGAVFDSPPSSITSGLSVGGCDSVESRRLLEELQLPERKPARLAFSVHFASGLRAGGCDSVESRRLLEELQLPERASALPFIGGFAL